MRLLHEWARAAVRFDEENLVSCAGLVPVMALAERAGLSGLVADKVKITNEPVPSTGANRPARWRRLWRGWLPGRTRLMIWM